MESLIMAIRRTDIPTVKAVLQSGSIANLNEGYNSTTPLCEACKVNSEESVHLLLSNGAGVNIPCGHLNKRPIHLACNDADDRFQIVQRLLEAGADVDAKDEDGNTGLHLACTQSNLGIVRLLLESGADANLEDVDRESPLLRACYAGQEDITELLLQYGALTSGICLLTCILHNFVKGVCMLYRASPDIKIKDVLSVWRMKTFENRTNLRQQNNIPVDDSNFLLPPLHIVCAYPQFCSYKAVIGILEILPRVHGKDDAGYNCLQYACYCVNLSAIQVLLAYGVNPHDDGWSPMWTYFPYLNQDNFSDYFMTLKLLYASGFHLDKESTKMFMEAIDAAQDIPTDERTNFRDFVIQYRLNPLSLKELSRNTIRRQIPANIDKNVLNLQSVLPSNLLDYLRFQDLLRPIFFD